MEHNHEERKVPRILISHPSEGREEEMKENNARIINHDQDELMQQVSFSRVGRLPNSSSHNSSSSSSDLSEE
jgi:hypothetical protein